MDVHETYCKNCPSKWHPQDPEAAGIEALPDGERQKYVFPCAWRREKLCKGVCEVLGFDPDKHGHLLGDRYNKL